MNETLEEYVDRDPRNLLPFSMDIGQLDEPEVLEVNTELIVC